MNHTQQQWWRTDLSSPEFKERQSFALWVSGPIIFGALLFRQVAGFDYTTSFIPALAFGALGWIGLRARQRHKQRSL
ncbi:hypothetical protein [Candidatus Poriferisodalis sp.]|uniref:hypothetical protein n=1 Tax=Candidatus Poriferisodalis sp. TaxID=3101277 RepID=UPI003B5281E4